jgi:hypothetical protein
MICAVAREVDSPDECSDPYSSKLVESGRNNSMNMGDHDILKSRTSKLMYIEIILHLSTCKGLGYLSRYSDRLRTGRSGDRIPVGGEIFRTRPDRPCGPPSLLYNGYRFFFSGVKRPGVDHPHHLAPRLKKE